MPDPAGTSWTADAASIACPFSLVTVTVHARAPGSGAGTDTPGQGIAHGSTPGLGAGTSQSGGTVSVPGCQTKFGKFCLGASGVPSMIETIGCVAHAVTVLSNCAVRPSEAPT